MRLSHVTENYQGLGLCYVPQPWALAAQISFGSLLVWDYLIFADMPLANRSTDSDFMDALGTILKKSHCSTDMETRTFDSI